MTQRSVIVNYPPASDVEQGRASSGTTAVPALGDVRATRHHPAYSLDRLRNHAALPNPNASAGCSPVLREILRQSGVPFAIVTELANDGQAHGHHGGNAIDVTPPSTGGTFDAITDALTPLASLFASVAYQGGGDQFLIWDGAVVTGSFTTDQVALLARCDGTVHISSSFNRINRATGHAALRDYFDAPTKHDPTVGPIYAPPITTGGGARIESVLSRVASI